MITGKSYGGHFNDSVYEKEYLINQKCENRTIEEVKSKKLCFERWKRICIESQFIQIQFG